MPEVEGSAFGSATAVRQVMDMTTGVRYSEDYDDPNADIWIYAAAASPLPKPQGYDGPNGYWEYLQQVQPEGEHGAAFGLSAGLRDLGRLGLLMLNECVVNGKRLFPAEVVQGIRRGGDRTKFGDAYPALVSGSYTSMWWVYPGREGVIAARRVHGQTIYVDPSGRMVVVRFASFPKPQNPLVDPTSLEVELSAPTGAARDSA